MAGASCPRSGTSRRWSEVAPQAETTRVAILLFEGCDLLDSGGPYEVFLTASRLAERDGQPRPFEVDMVTIDGEPVRAYGGLGLVPTAGPPALGESDLIIVPGTIDLKAPLGDDALLSTITTAAARAEVTVASVCTGAFLLGRVGLLEGRRWTTHWEDIEALGEQIGSDGATTGVRWVDSGAVVTGGALASGIALSLYLVERFAGEALAQRTTRQLDYAWDNESVVIE